MAESPFRNTRSRLGAAAQNALDAKPETLQDKIIENDEELRWKRASQRTELAAKLPAMPHEVEIKAELRDEEELLQLYKELEAKKAETGAKRREIALKKVEKLEKEKEEHEKRLQ